MTIGHYGRLPKTDDARDYRFTAPAPYTGAFVDLTDGFPEPPYDQGQLGSCVSNGTAAILDYARAKQGLPPLNRPSRLFLYFQGRVRGGYPLNQDTGLEVRDGLKVASKDGAPPEDTDWPYNVDRFTEKPPAQAYADALQDVAVKFAAVQPGQVDAAIAAGYPVVFGVDLWESFESDEVARTGVMPAPDKAREQKVGGHCMVIVSTRKDGSEIQHGKPGTYYYRVRNSWGESWGDEGYVWIPESVIAGLDAADFWTLTRVNDPNVTPPEPPSPRPDALVAAARALSQDQGVLGWLRVKHSGTPKRVATLVQAVVDAARSQAA